jgi:hypothetical protein
VLTLNNVQLTNSFSISYNFETRLNDLKDVQLNAYLGYYYAGVGTVNRIGTISHIIHKNGYFLKIWIK